MLELEKNYIYLRNDRYGGYSLYRVPLNKDINSCEKYIGDNRWIKVPVEDVIEMELLMDVSYNDASFIRDKIDKEEKSSL